jgi:DNA-binding response OmpR family regulator
MKPNLLITDGDAEMCDLCAQFLTESGYEVESATDGLECLRKLRQMMPVALVLDLDLRWGGADGVLDWMRAESSTREVLVILTAAAGYAQYFSEFIEPPVVDFLLKPFTLSALLGSVRAAVARTGRIEPSNRDRVPA